MKLRGVRSRGEEGSALIIALVFLTTTAVLVAAILSFTEVGLKATKGYRFKERAGISYAAEAGIATAIQRYSTTGPCENLTAPLVRGAAGPTPINGTGAIVRCDGPAPAGAPATQPVNSLLSLGKGPTDGIFSEELRVLGDVSSNTKISATGTMVVQGEVSAVGTCTGPIQTVPFTKLRCAPETANPTRGRYPDYTPATTAVPVRRSVPGCPATWLVKLDPGYYDDADALSALTGPRCATSTSKKVVWFQPGTYYFDLGFRRGPTTWLIDNPDVTVVGGMPRGFNPGSTSPDIPKVPGSCKTNGDLGVLDGVQFIAGGGTNLVVNRGQMELCATPSKTAQQIALFGLPGAPPSEHRLEATQIMGTGFSPALDAQSIGEDPPAVAKADLGASLTKASLDLGKFRPGIPSGSLIDTVSLKVRHREDGNPVDLALFATFPRSVCTEGQPAPVLVVPASPGVFTENSFDLGLSCKVGRLAPDDINDLVVTYTGTLPNPGAPPSCATGTPMPAACLQVDGIALDVTYRTPETRKPTVATGLTTPPGGAGFANGPNAFEIGEQPTSTSDATFSASGTTAASITLDGLAEPPLAAGTTIDSVVLRVAHQDQGNAAAPRISVPVIRGTCLITLGLQAQGIGEERVDLKDPSCGVDTVEELNSLKATFIAGLASGGASATSRLDGVWLEVVSRPPSTRPSPPPPSRRRPSLATSSPAAPGTTAFSNPDQARFIQEVPPELAAIADLSGPANSAALTVTNFDSVPLPVGSKITAANLRVNHKEDGNADVAIAATVPATPSSPGGTCSPLIVPSTQAYAVTGVDLKQCNLDSPEQLAGLAATWTATRKALPATLKPSTADSADFSPADAGRQIDNTTAKATTTGSVQTRKIKLSGFSQTPPPPTGSTVETAKLRIVHQDDGDIPTGATVEVAFPDGTCPTATLPIRKGAITLDEVPLCGPALAKLPDLSVTYNVVSGTGDASDLLDGVEVDLTYRPPALDLLDGIELDLIFEAPRLRPLCAAVCDLLTVNAGPTDNPTRFVAGGTVYAPSAGVKLAMTGLDFQVLRRGMVARSMTLGLKSKPGYERPLGGIPPEVVTFTAYPDKTLAPSNVVPTGFSEPPGWAANRSDGVVAEAGLDKDPLTAPPETANVVLKYGPTDLPGGSVIDQAVLRVRHQDDASSAQVSVKVDGVSCGVPQELRVRPGSLGEDQIDLGTCGGRLATVSRLNKVEVTYTVKVISPRATATATAKLDGITLDVLSGPVVRASVTFDRTKATVENYSVLG